MDLDKLVELAHQIYYMDKAIKSYIQIQFAIVMIVSFFIFLLCTVMIYTKIKNYVDRRKIEGIIRDEVKECHKQFIASGFKKEYERIADLIIFNLENHLNKTIREEALSRVIGKVTKDIDSFVDLYKINGAED